LRDTTHQSAGSGSYKVNYGRDDGRDNNPEELEPVEERNANELRLPEVVEGRIKQGDKWDEQ
jgi:hypothetical protein